MVDMDEVDKEHIRFIKRFSDFVKKIKAKSKEKKLNTNELSTLEKEALDDLFEKNDICDHFFSIYAQCMFNLEKGLSKYNQSFSEMNESFEKCARVLNINID